MSKFEIVVSCLDLDIEDLDLSDQILEALGEDTHLTCVDGDARVRAVMDADCAMAAFEVLAQSLRDHNVKVMAVRPTLLSISDIAEAVSLNREAVRLWTVGKRGPGDFPEPVDIVGGRIKVWAAADVWRWLALHHLLHGEARPLTLDEVTDCERTLERMRRRWAAIPLLDFAPDWRPVAGPVSDVANVAISGSRRRGGIRASA